MFDNPSSRDPILACRIEQIRPQYSYTGLLKITNYGLSIVVDEPTSSRGGQDDAGINRTPSNQSFQNSMLNKPFWHHSLIVSLKVRISNQSLGGSLKNQNIYNSPRYPSSVLCITYRNFVALRITFSGSNGDRDINIVWAEIQKWINTVSLNEMHCFSKEFAVPPTLPATALKDWLVFDPLIDFARMGLGSFNKNWRISTINQDYKFCPTYPSLIGVPSRISDNTLRHIGKFRSKGRIPALSYIHNNQATITRSAQPMVGWKQDRSIQDEKLIEAIFCSHLMGDEALESSVSLPGKQMLHLIIDARPLANAMAQVALGAGTEIESNYPGSKLVFLGIENIHVVRDSFNRLYDACVVMNGSISRSAMERSGWLKHIKTIIDGTNMIVTNLHQNGSHALIHCSDGWDRTAQLSSLAQICLDPYYRTIEGLFVVLEKEWISFGHKFQDRCGHLSRDVTGSDAANSLAGSDRISSVEHKLQQASKNMFGAASKLFSTLTSNSTGSAAGMNASQNTATSETLTPTNVAPKEMSPVFPQFLDCLYQIWKQYPTEFEYDERIFEFLFIACYSGTFGNFLFNNEKESREFRSKGNFRPIHEETISIWTHIRKTRSAFLNPAYIPPEITSPAVTSDIDLNSPTFFLEGESRKVLFPSSSDLVYWSRMYKITKHSFADDDAVLSTSNVSSIAPPEVVTKPKSGPLDHLDPLVPLVKLSVSTPLEVNSGVVLFKSPPEMVDLQGNQTLKKPDANNSFDPLLNPWQ